MPLLNDKQFSKITRMYNCDNKIFGAVREHIINNYILKENIQVGRCLVTISDNSKRWSIIRRKDRYFDLAFTYWEFTGDISSGRRPFLHLAYDGVEELTKDELEKRIEAQPVEEVLREAKEIINPIYKTKYNG